ncbi:fluoride efflux transporter CrcB [Oricola cellulosilytica]|uniref:Fluoride-specific ion channel FluC n=1 Tax=Oricola cellulosilytica TaxID=1429082 RepID=A0A4R0P7S6_9HYPH|nr:fluoride efflux transporter CrcB [Oricola cellulosilytica]TCD13110.1 fluoride efflux transporter CrcB [Oricola cellulosilytica]
MSHLLLVALGGAIGASARHLANLVALRIGGPNFPWGTLFVNIAGSFAMGLLIAGLARRTGTSMEVRSFLATGVLGGFTTFSAFSLDFASLWERGEQWTGVAYLAASVSLSILALFAGLTMVRAA